MVHVLCGGEIYHVESTGKKIGRASGNHNKQMPICFTSLGEKCDETTSVSLPKQHQGYGAPYYTHIRQPTREFASERMTTNSDGRLMNETPLTNRPGAFPTTAVRQTNSRQAPPPQADESQEP